MDKEQVIIDGVSVNECKGYYFSPTEYHSCQDISQVNDLGYEQDTLCEQNPNCYFKQLARKTQECEELKKEQLEIKKYLGISHKSILERLEELQERRDELSEKNLSYEQVLDEIKYQTTELYIGVENKDRPYCEKILDIINKAKELELTLQAKEINNG